MIRAFQPSDMTVVLDIWLAASIKAHDFIEASYWESQVDNMKNIYLPSSEVYVFEESGKVQGFYALHGQTLAAIFVEPSCQGLGIGKKLLQHAKSQREQLDLTVYKDNEASIRFYLAQGFKVVSEQRDSHTGYAELKMVLD